MAILPQYLVNLIQPIGQKERQIFPYANETVQATFEDFGIVLDVFMCFLLQFLCTKNNFMDRGTNHDLFTYGGLN